MFAGTLTKITVHCSRSKSTISKILCKISRNALEATALETGCHSVQVESVAIESGLRNGSPYRFESVESFKLELQNGKWQAVSAAAKQR